MGTPDTLTNANGEVVWNVSYQSYGNVALAKVAEIDQPIRFQGQYYDEETGFHYNRFRYYDPLVGQFTTQDPIGLHGGANCYLYAPNPIAWTDPFGLSCKEEKDHQLVIGAYSSSTTGHAVVVVIDPRGEEVLAGLSMSDYRGPKDLFKALKGSPGYIHAGSLAETKARNPDFESISTPITRTQADKALEKIYEYADKTESGEFKYNLLNRQCAIFACEVSEAAGVKPPNAGRTIRRPKKLHKSIKKINSEKTTSPGGLKGG
ncbi:hypothetical protein GCM10008940_34370 [Microbulbifer agarilyticus]